MNGLIIKYRGFIIEAKLRNGVKRFDIWKNDRFDNFEWSLRDCIDYINDYHAIKGFNRF